MKQKLILITMIPLFLSPLFGQLAEHTFSGDYYQVSFDSFVESMEKSNGLKFFYRTEWTSGVTITAMGNEWSLAEVLTQNLEPLGLTYYIEEGNNVFILNGVTIHTIDDFTADEVTNKSSQVEIASVESKAVRYFGGPEEEETIESKVIGKNTDAVRNGSVNLYGKIWDVENGESLVGATIYFPDTKTGRITDLYGHFEVVISTGSYLVLVNCVGMKGKKYMLTVYSDGRLDVGMERDIIPIQELVITAKRNQNVSGIQMGHAQIDISTMKVIPLVMGEKDVLRVAQMLPGIQSVGEGSSGFNVRGSSVDQNMVYVNKIPVYNTSHLFGFFSSFSPDIIKDFNLYKSNIPVEFGGRIASVFNISTREGNKNNLTARGGISPVTGHIALEGPIKKEKHSFVLSARSTYSDWLLRFLEDPLLRDSRASFYDLSAGITLEPDTRNLIKVFAYYSSDKFQYTDLLNYDYQNSGASLTWRHRIKPALSSDLALVFSQYSFGTVNKENISSAYSHHYTIGQYEINSDLLWVPVKNHTLTFGGKMIYYSLKRGDILPFGAESLKSPVSLGSDNGLEGDLYLSDKYEILPGLTLYGGLRYSIFTYLGPSVVYTYYADAPREPANITDTLHFKAGQPVRTYSGPDFRFAVNLSTGAGSSVKLSYNRTRQYLFLLSNTIAIAPTDQWKLCDYHIRPLYGDQVSAGFYKDFPDWGVSTSTEVYVKKLHNLVEYKAGADFTGSAYVERDVLQGLQDAYGFELMLEKEKGKLNGWISYAYSRSRITIDGVYPWEKINGGVKYPANYDKPHALNLILNYRINRRFSLSGNVVYSTGRPVTYPVSSYNLLGQEIINFSDRNAYRIPDYFRMDLSVNIEGNLKAKKNIHSYWMLNIYNLTGRKNAYSVFYRSEEGLQNSYRMSIFGTTIVSLSWNFKFGNYASQ
jgi:hypothetical protein